MGAQPDDDDATPPTGTTGLGDVLDVVLFAVTGGDHFACRKALAPTCWEYLANHALSATRILVASVSDVGRVLLWARAVDRIANPTKKKNLPPLCVTVAGQTDFAGIVGALTASAVADRVVSLSVSADRSVGNPLEWACLTDLSALRGLRGLQELRLDIRTALSAGRAAAFAEALSCMRRLTSLRLAAPACLTVPDILRLIDSSAPALEDLTVCGVRTMYLDDPTLPPPLFGAAAQAVVWGAGAGARTRTVARLRIEQSACLLSALEPLRAKVRGTIFVAGSLVVSSMGSSASAATPLGPPLGPPLGTVDAVMAQIVCAPEELRRLLPRPLPSLERCYMHVLGLEALSREQRVQRIEHELADSLADSVASIAPGLSYLSLIFVVSDSAAAVDLRLSAWGGGRSILERVPRLRAAVLSRLPALAGAAGGALHVSEEVSSADYALFTSSLWL